MSLEVAVTSSARRLQLLAAMEIDVYVRRSPAPATLTFRFAPTAPDPWSGPHGRLFAQLARTLGFTPATVRVARDPALALGGLAIAFGVDPAGHPAPIAAPSPAELAGSAAAKRALWRALRERRGG